ncbi:MAG: hypothetical protein QF773_01100, partial [Lentisphaeria bacterium]|nr:hypothetical protein [Lentisphaeria bacterium]
MTNAERMFAAIRRQPIDRVPFATYNFHPFSAEHANDPSYAELLELVTARAGMLCKAHAVARPAEPQQWGTIDVTSEDLPTQAITRRTLHTPKGDLTSVTVKPADQPALVTEHFIKTDADIDRYMSLPHVPATYDVAPLARLSDKLAGRGLLYVGYDDAMYAAASLFDFNDFAIRCHTDIGAVKRFVDFHFERVRDNVRRLVTACRGLPALFYTAGPELCTPPMTSPAVFAALVTPYQRQLIEIIHDAGLAAAIHCHGRVRSILEEVLETGADVLEPIEPPPQGDITLAEYGLLDCFGRAVAQQFAAVDISDQTYLAAVLTLDLADVHTRNGLDRIDRVRTCLDDHIENRPEIAVTVLDAVGTFLANYIDHAFQ